VSVTENYFELFGISPAFDLDIQQLSQSYRRLQQNTHPDRFSTAGKDQQLLSVQYAAAINDAYQTLKSPLNRAIYLLRLEGVEVAGDSSASLEPDFLMQQIELREQLEAVRAQPDTEQALEQLASELEQQTLLLGQAFQQAYLASHWDSASEAVNKLQFIVKMQQQLDVLEDELLEL